MLSLSVACACAACAPARPRFSAPQVIKEAVYDAFYKLTDSSSQIRSYVFDVVRATVPNMLLDDVRPPPFFPCHPLLAPLSPENNTHGPLKKPILFYNRKGRMGFLNGPSMLPGRRVVARFVCTHRLYSGAFGSRNKYLPLA